MLPAAVRIGELPPPFELLVMDVTDQGRRRPTKVARLVPLGARTAVAELVAPKLVLVRGADLVLSGTELVGTGRSPLNAGQTWLCRLALPATHASFKVWTNHNGGVEVMRRRVLSMGPNVTGAEIAVGSVMHEALGRHTTQALVKRNGLTPLTLIDCELDWMAEERFCLSGFQQYPDSADWPARLLKQGWLCEHDVPAPVAVAGQERLLRKMSLR